VVSWRCGSAALAHRQGRQFVSAECFNAQCEGLETCSHTKFLWFINFLTMTKKCDFSLQHGQKEKINFFSKLGSWMRLIFMGMGCDKTEHALLGDRTSCELPQKEQSWRKHHCLGCHVQARSNRPNVF
jgi:hypothetical protein